MRDCARRLTSDVATENLADNLGLFLDDRQLAGLTQHRTIAERAPTSVPPVSDDAFKAASGVQH
ncbi:hypothetical protein [Bradyrhizobium sp. S3.9.2]|uniref:hypothetical protein n=1 Tax=Bradyrhizobium sp. S3.9.2 TaxID=3156432 RepID=UPI0033940CF3